MLKQISTEISARVPNIHFNQYITIVVPSIYIYNERQPEQLDWCNCAKQVFYFCSCHDYQLSLNDIFI